MRVLTSLGLYVASAQDIFPHLPSHGTRSPSSQDRVEIGDHDTLFFRQPKGLIEPHRLPAAPSSSGIDDGIMQTLQQLAGGSSVRIRDVNAAGSSSSSSRLALLAGTRGEAEGFSSLPVVHGVEQRR